LPPSSLDQLVIAISATGGSIEVLAAAQRYSGIRRLVAITNTADSALAQLADLVIPLLADAEVSGVACPTFRHTFIVLSEVLICLGAPAYASETGDWSHVDVYITKTLDYRALLFAGSAWDDQALDWLAQRGSTVVSVGRDLEQAVFSLRYPGDDDRMTATLAETVVAELVAWDWYRADPEYSWSERVIL
jgi:fructoselysine-6-P-deglycase FrlB-like protein